MTTNSIHCADAHTPHGSTQAQLPASQGRALVVFSGQTDLLWLRILRKGYRHCFVVVETPTQNGATWVLYNPLSNGTQVEHWSIGDESVVRAWLVGQGYRVVETYVRPLNARLFGWRPYTCVEAVKRVLRLHAPAVTTPWQLCKFLNNEINQKKITIIYMSEQ